MSAAQPHVRRNRLAGLVLAFAIYCLDRWIKGWVAGPLGLAFEGSRLDLLPFFDLYRVHNTGVSLGMFAAKSPEMRWMLVAGTSLIALVVFVWLLRERKLGDIVPLGMVLGGASGNIHDRVVHGYVLDYADLHIGAFRPFQVFNLADAMICIGVVIILARALFMREKPPAPQGINEAGQDSPAADRSAENT